MLTNLLVSFPNSHFNSLIFSILTSAEINKTYISEVMKYARRVVPD
jgi:hypothetical protein